MFQLRVTGAPGWPGLLAVESVGDSKSGGGSVTILLLVTGEKIVQGISSGSGRVTLPSSVQVIKLNDLSI